MDVTSTEFITATIAGLAAIGAAIVVGCRVVFNALKGGGLPRSREERIRATEAGGGMTDREYGQLATNVEHSLRIALETDERLREHIIDSVKIHGEMWQVIVRRMPPDDGPLRRSSRMLDEPRDRE